MTTIPDKTTHPISTPVTATKHVRPRALLLPLFFAAACAFAPDVNADPSATWTGGATGPDDIAEIAAVTVTISGGGTFTIAAVSEEDSPNILQGQNLDAVLTVEGGTNDVLRLQGAYTLSNAFAGKIEVASGTLELFNTDTASSSYYRTITANNTGTLRFLNNLNLQHSAVALAGTGKFVLADSVAGTSQIGVLSGTAGEILLGANTLRVNNGNDATTFAGTISGTGGNLSVYGGKGSLALSGVNAYTGTTRLNSGTLLLTGSGSIAASTTLILETGAKFDISGVTTSSGPAVVQIQNLSEGLGDGVSPDLAHQSSINLGSNTLEITGTGATGSNITGGGSLIMSGSGTLALSGTLSHHGHTVVSGSTAVLEFQGASFSSDSGSELHLENGAKFKPTASAWTTLPALYGTAGTEVILRGGTLQIWNGGNFAGVIKDESSETPTAFDFASNNTLTLSGENTYTGSTTLHGKLVLSGAGSIANSESLYFYTNGTLDISAATSPVVTVKGLRSALVTGIEVVLGENTLNVTPGANYDTFYGAISGDGGLTVSGAGAGTLALFGVNTYTGATTVSGTVTLSLDANTLTELNSSIALSSGVTLEDNARFSITNISGIATIKKLNSESGTTVVLGNQTLDVQGTGTETIAGTVTGGTSGVLIYSGGDTLSITGTSTQFFGTTKITGTSIVALTGAGALISSVSLEDTGKLDISGVTTTPNALDSSIEIKTAGTVIRGLSGTANTTVDLGAKTLVLISGGTFEGVISGTGGIYANNWDLGLEFTNENTYTGPTALVFGLTLSGSGSIAASSAVELKGGTLDLSKITSSTTIQNLSSWNTGAKIVLGTKTLVVNTPDGWNQFVGDISGNGNLTKTGAATFALRSVNSYTGLTTVSGTGSQLMLEAAGDISASSGVKLEAGGIFNISSITPATGTTIKNLEGATGTTVNLSGKNLEINGTANGTFAGSINGTGDLTKSGSGTLTLSGWNSYTGSTTVSGSATLALEGYSSRIVDSSGVTLNNTAKLDITGIGGSESGAAIISGLSSTFSGTEVSFGIKTLEVAGGGSFAGKLTGGTGSKLIKSGASLLTLSGDGKLDIVNVSAGELRINGTMSGGSVNNVALTVANDATLGGEGTITGLVTVAGDGNIAPGDGKVGTLFVSGSVSLAPAANLLVQVQGSGGPPTGNDKVIMNTGTFSFDPGSNIIVTLDGTTTTDNIHLLLVGGTVSIDISSVNLSQPTEWECSLVLNPGGYAPGLYLTNVLVPEPGTYGLLVGIGAVGLALLRRRKKKK